MIKISVLVTLVVAVLWVGYQTYGVSGLVKKETRGRHCARGRAKLFAFGREAPQHKDGRPAWDTITGAQVHILPSRYYSTVRPSAKGLAHAA